MVQGLHLSAIGSLRRNNNSAWEYVINTFADPCRKKTAQHTHGHCMINIRNDGFSTLSYLLHTFFYARLEVTRQHGKKTSPIDPDLESRWYSRGGKCICCRHDDPRKKMRSSTAMYTAIGDSFSARGKISCPVKIQPNISSSKIHLRH